MSKTFEQDTLDRLADILASTKLINATISHQLRDIKNVKAGLSLLEEKVNRLQKQVQYLNEQNNKD